MPWYFSLNPLAVDPTLWGCPSSSPCSPSLGPQQPSQGPGSHNNSPRKKDMEGSWEKVSRSTWQICIVLAELYSSSIGIVRCHRLQVSCSRPAPGPPFWGVPASRVESSVATASFHSFSSWAWKNPAKPPCSTGPPGLALDGDPNSFFWEVVYRVTVLPSCFQEEKSWKWKSWVRSKR